MQGFNVGLSDDRFSERVCSDFSVPFDLPGEVPGDGYEVHEGVAYRRFFGGGWPLVESLSYVLFGRSLDEHGRPVYRVLYNRRGSISAYYFSSGRGAFHVNIYPDSEWVVELLVPRFYSQVGFHLPYLGVWVYQREGDRYRFHNSRWALNAEDWGDPKFAVFDKEHGLDRSRTRRKMSMRHRVGLKTWERIYAPGDMLVPSSASDRQTVLESFIALADSLILLDPRPVPDVLCLDSVVNYHARPLLVPTPWGLRSLLPVSSSVPPEVFGTVKEIWDAPVVDWVNVGAPMPVVGVRTVYALRDSLRPMPDKVGIVAPLHYGFVRSEYPDVRWLTWDPTFCLDAAPGVVVSRLIAPLNDYGRDSEDKS